MGYGHSGVAVAIIALVVSTAFLVWVSEKQDSPHQKFGKFIAWASIVISAIIIIGSAVMCFRMCSSGMCPMMGGRAGMMMRGPGGMMQGPGGMGMMPGMQQGQPQRGSGTPSQ